VHSQQQPLHAPPPPHQQQQHQQQHQQHHQQEQQQFMSSNGVNSLAVLAKTVQQQPYTDDYYDNREHYDNFDLGLGTIPSAPYHNSNKRRRNGSISYDDSNSDSGDSDGGDSVDMELEHTPPQSPRQSQAQSQAQQQQLQDEPDELELPPALPLLVGPGAASGAGQPWSYSSGVPSSTC
jgi:hypothetical protein